MTKQPIRASKLQEQRHAELVAKIERTVERRERLLASVCRLTSNIATMARQVRRYEKITVLTPKIIPAKRRRS